MRIVVAVCSVIYSGRGDTKLPIATRAIIIKDDGAISIHSDFGNKPLNYMGKGNIHTEVVDPKLGKVWNFDTRKENLQIRLIAILSDSNHTLEMEEPGLLRDGTEPQLQAWLAENPEALGQGYTLVKREYPTGAGPVDLLVRDEEGKPVAVEVKRVAMLGAVDQVRRYVEALAPGKGFSEVRGIIAALDVRPKTAELAAKRGIEYVILPAHWREKPEEE
jgi:RecB family endonuclease NucS